jgi:hypothetical protein
LAGGAAAKEEVKEERKDMNLETLMKTWAAKYDPIVDINEELKDV